MPEAGSAAARSSGDTAAPARRSGLVAVPRAVVSGGTWLAVIHLFAGLFIGIAALVLLIVGIAVGVATLPVFLLGIPVLAATFALCGLFARAERARLAFFLGTDIPAAPPPHRLRRRRMVRPMRSATGWRYLCYAFVRCPLSLIQVVLLSVAWSLGPALSSECPAPYQSR